MILFFFAIGCAACQEKFMNPLIEILAHSSITAAPVFLVKGTASNSDKKDHNTDFYTRNVSLSCVMVNNTTTRKTKETRL